jgi:DNA-binding SARP family transcriptional activator
VTHQLPALAWRLRLLGGFALESHGHRLTRLHSRWAVLLLARLALRARRDHAREELPGWLWPEAEARTGLARLRQTLSTLKGLLERDTGLGTQATLGATAGSGAAGRVIDADRVAQRLVPGALQCDAVMLEAACQQGQAGCAAELYRGELLPGHYDDWILEERQRLQAPADALPGPAAAVAGASAQPVAASLPTKAEPARHRARQPSIARPAASSAALAGSGIGGVLPSPYSTM